MREYNWRRWQENKENNERMGKRGNKERRGHERKGDNRTFDDYIKLVCLLGKH